MNRIQTGKFSELTVKETKVLKEERNKKIDRGEYIEANNGQLMIKGLKPIHHFIRLPCSDDLMPLKDAFRIICDIREKKYPDNAEIYRGIFHTGQATSFFSRSMIEIVKV